MLIGLLLRVWQCCWYPLREDEALYGYWARLIVSGRDVMLERVAVDKPPFFIYTLARWFEWFGSTDASGRSLNVLISVLTMVAVWLLGRRVFGPRGGLWSLAFFALSPFAISFAPTMYTDPLLTLWIVLALLAASWRLGLLTGLALGMGFATKQNALLFIPLILPALLLGHYPKVIANMCKKQMQGEKQRLMRIIYWILPVITMSLGFGYIWHKVWQWDGWRILPANIPDFWTQSWHSYGGLRLVAAGDWPARLIEWWQVWRWWGGSLAGTVIITALGIIAVLASKFDARNARTQTGFSSDDEEDEQLDERKWILLFALFSITYLALHFFFSFQAWDRYLLPLTPLIAILSAQGALWLWEQSRFWRLWKRWIAVALLATGVLWGAGRAASARIPVGGDHGAFDGLPIVADYLRQNTPFYHGLVYQRWLGWQWNWYLWDGPPREYWANPDMLVENLASHPTGYTRFVVFPGWYLDEKPTLQRALEPLGLNLETRLRLTDPESDRIMFVVYQIVGAE